MHFCEISFRIKVVQLIVLHYPCISMEALKSYRFVSGFLQLQIMHNVEVNPKFVWNAK